MLVRSLEQVKNLTPVLISGIKIFITAKQSSKFAFLSHGRSHENGLWSDNVLEGQYDG